MPMSLVRLPPDAWPALAELIFRCNRRSDGGVHCLHAAQGTDVASHAAELRALHPDEAAFWAISDGAQRLGVVGCEFEPALARAWVRGPLVIDPRRLEGTVALVAAGMEGALPAVQQFDAFPAADADLLNRWYATAGYEALQLHRVLRAPVAQAHASSRAVRQAAAGDLPALLGLHQELFPGAYVGEADFHRALAPDRDCVLFVASGDDAAAIGYLYVKDDPVEQEAYIDYLGVMQAQRGQGFGRALLDSAFSWAARRGRGHLALTVRQDRHSALSLYQQAGFVEVSAGRHWRKVASRAP